MRSPASRGPLLLALLTLLVAAGCGKSNKGPTQPDPDPGPAAGIVVSDAVPASGNATLTGVTVLAPMDTTITGVPGKHVRILGTSNAGTVSEKKHRIDVLFLASNGMVTSVTHAWGTSLSPGAPRDAINKCTSCPSSEVSVNQSTKKITMDGLVLPNDSIDPANTSTLTGVNTYP